MADAGVERLELFVPGTPREVEGEEKRRCFARRELPMGWRCTPGSLGSPTWAAEGAASEASEERQPRSELTRSTLSTTGEEADREEARRWSESKPTG